jgi:hypothetical protein
MNNNSSPNSQFSSTNSQTKPSIAGRIRYVMQDPKFSTTDRIEYGAYWLASGGLIAFMLIAVFWAVAQGSLSTAQCLIQLVFIFGLLPLIAWRLLRKFNQRFSYAYHESVGGEEYAKKIAKQNEHLPTLVQKSATSYVSFSIISGVLTLIYVVLLVPFIFLATFLELDSGIMIAVIVISSLAFLGVLVFVYKLTWKPTNDFREQAFPNAPSFSRLEIFLIAGIVLVVIVIGAALGFHFLSP